MSDRDRIRRALAIAMDHGYVDGAHHKMWVIDQMVRALTTEEEYRAFVELTEDDDGVVWDHGVPP